jgi:hypothetical protein
MPKDEQLSKLERSKAPAIDGRCARAPDSALKTPHVRGGVDGFLREGAHETNRVERVFTGRRLRQTRSPVTTVADVALDCGHRVIADSVSGRERHSVPGLVHPLDQLSRGSILPASGRVHHQRYGSRDRNAPRRVHRDVRRFRRPARRGLARGTSPRRTAIGFSAKP